jgi:hypothetical protein
MADDTWTGCGISWLWGTSEDDPFYSACVWHDEATTEGSWWQQHKSLDYVQEVFRRRIDSIIERHPELTIQGEAYKAIADLATPFFWEGKQKEMPKEIAMEIRRIEIASNAIGASTVGSFLV